MQSLTSRFPGKLIARYSRVAAADDLKHPKRPVVYLFFDEKGSPHGDLLAVGIDDVERLVQVEVHPRLGPRPPDAKLQCLGQPANCVGIDFVVPRVRPFADGRTNVAQV